jgi:hypothetical protein
MFKFLEDYLIYNKDNEVPETYHLWSALGLMSATIGHQVWITQGQFVHRANLYICLIGKQGNRKTSAKDIAYDIFREVAPDMPVTAETTSREAITQDMAREENTKQYRYGGDIIEYKPLAIFCTELKNFLSVNPAGMIEFLTTIYDRKFYDAKYKNKGTDLLVNPYVVFFACETPEWIVSRLKEAIISGGFSRRTIYVYEMRYGRRISFPKLDDVSKEALVRVKQHLRDMQEMVGEFQWTPAAVEFYDKWYQGVKTPTDPLLEGFYSSKHVQLMKISMLLALCNQPFKLEIDKVHLEYGLHMLDNIEKNLPRLSEAVGRNEQAIPAAKIIEFVAAAGGSIPEKKLQMMMFRDMPPQEFMSVIQHLEKTEQIRKVADASTGVARTLIVNAEWLKQKQAEGKVKPPTPPREGIK